MSGDEDEAGVQACPGAPRCEVEAGHIHAGDAVVMGEGWLVDLMTRPDLAVAVRPPVRRPRKRR